MAGTDPTPQELQNLALCGQKLWDLDDNRLQNGVDYQINVGHGKKAYDTNDAASEKLFTHVSQNVWQRPTYRLLATLRDNYSVTTGAAESETAQERQEVEDFFNAIMATRPMMYTHKFEHVFLGESDNGQISGFHNCTSPEFEFALLSLYFVAGSERNNIVIDGYELCIRCHPIMSKYGNKIGSAFAELMGEQSSHHS